MSVLTGSDIPHDVFGGTLTEVGPSNMPSGGSPANLNVEFLPGLARTRGGLQPQQEFTVAGGPYQVRYVKSYGQVPENQTELVLLVNPTTNGQGIMAIGPNTVVGNVFGYGQYQPWFPYAQNPGWSGSLALSSTQFGREYIAISEGRYGYDLPRQWDGTNYDRVSQCGVGAAPTVQNFLPAVATVAGSGAGTSKTITGVVTTDLQIFVVPPKPPSWKGGVYTYYFAATYSTSTAHGLTAGEVVAIAGVSNPIFDFTQVMVVSVPSTTSFTISFFSETLVSSSGGTVTFQNPSIIRNNNQATVNTSAAHGFVVGWTVQISGFSPTAVGGAATATQQNGTVTVTTATPHGLVPGTIVIVVMSSDDTYNTPGYNLSGAGIFVGGTGVLTTPSPTTFTYGQETADATATGGTVSVPWNGNFLITSTPTTTTFTYTNLGPNLITNASGTATIIGNISPGLHQVSVSFITRQGYITRPAPPANFYAGGAQLAQLTIPTGPSNVVARLIMFTGYLTPPATTGDFYAIRGTGLAGNLMQINDNVTTNVVLDFSDTELDTAFSCDYLFNLVELGCCAGSFPYSSRMFWWGELNMMQDFLNMEFNGGWNLGGGTGGADVPLGWTSDPTYGAGGSQLANGGVWLDAYRITFGVGFSGLIGQPAFQNYLGNTLIASGTSYDVRVTCRSSTPDPGNFITVHIISASAGLLASVTISPTTTGYQTYIVPFSNPLPAPIPPDAQLHIFGQGAGGQYIDTDRIEIYPEKQPINYTVLRASYANDPESFDGVTGLIQPIYSNGDAIRAVYPLRDSLYIACGRSTFVTKNTAGNEPALWTIDQVSDSIGAVGPNAAAGGEDWEVKANRYGLYIYLGREPEKLSQEIQTLWNKQGYASLINWQYGYKIWVSVDLQNKRVYIGAPTGSSSDPNTLFVMDYNTLDTSEMIAQYPTLRFSPYTGRRVILEQGRKWTIWQFAAPGGGLLTIPCGAFIELSNGLAQFVMGGGADNNVYLIDPTQRGNDNGQPCVSNYTTHFFPTQDEEQGLQLRSHMHGFSFGRFYISGYGNANLFMYENTLGSTTNPTNPKLIGKLNLTNPAVKDTELTFDEMKSERWSLMWQTSALNEWWQTERVTRTVEIDPDEIIRGSNLQ